MREKLQYFFYNHREKYLGIKIRIQGEIGLERLKKYCIFEFKLFILYFYYLIYFTCLKMKPEKMHCFFIIHFVQFDSELDYLFVCNYEATQILAYENTNIKYINNFFFICL